MVAELNYRPYPPLTTRAVMGQVWSELLFAHWPIAAHIMRKLVPAGLELDTFEGQAWVGVVPFRMSNIRLFGLPPIPFAARFEELNVRTYVTLDGRPGVYFFSLDANNPLAVATARSWYHLPYFNAKMVVTSEGNQINYYSQRTHRHFPPGEFAATYSPIGDVFQAQPGTLEYWLTARYCLYSAYRERIFRGEIHHAPWPLQLAQANFSTNTVAQSHGIELPDTAPLLHYAQRLEVRAWPIKRIR